MRYRREKWWHYWYGLEARVSALWHWLRGHSVNWYANGKDSITDDPGFNGECVGDIVCETCGLLIWCRWRFEA